MIILGIDPGSTIIGYALIETGQQAPILLAASCINLEKTVIEERIPALYRNLNTIIQNYNPSIASVEKLFFSTNIKTAFSVSESRGVILLTTSLAGLKVFEYTPLEVKKTMTGDGRADKKQVEKMVRLSLKEAKNLSARDDVFDAIAIALTCAYNIRYQYPR